MDKMNKGLDLEESYTSDEEVSRGVSLLRSKMKAAKCAKSLIEVFDSITPPPQNKEGTAGVTPIEGELTSNSENEQSDIEASDPIRWKFPKGNYRFAAQVTTIFEELRGTSQFSKPFLWDHRPENPDLFHENSLVIKEEQEWNSLLLRILWAQKGDPKTPGCWLSLGSLKDATEGDTAWEKVYATRLAFYEYDLINELLIKTSFPQAELAYRSREEEAFNWFDTCDKKLDPWAMERLLKLQSNPNTTQTKLSLIDRELEELDQQLDYYDQCYADWRQQAHIRKRGRHASSMAWKKVWSRPLPMTLNEPWENISDIDVLKTAQVFGQLLRFIHTKRNAFINVQTMMEKVMDKLEIQHHRLNIAQDLKEAISKDHSRSGRVEYLKYYKDSFNMTPPEILQFYQWKNVKTNTRKFGNAEFKLHETQDLKQGIPTDLSAELLIFPTVKQMVSKGSQGDALYVKLADLKRMLKPLGYHLDENIEDAAKTEAKTFVSDLRTHVPAGHLLYPMPGSTCLRMLCATLDFEKTLNPENPVPNISFKNGFNIVHVTQDFPYNRSSKINDSFVLQKATTKNAKQSGNKPFHLPLTDAQAVINHACTSKVWLGPSIDPEKPDFETKTQEDMLQNWPDSVWQKQNPHFTWRHWDEAMTTSPNPTKPCVLDKQSMAVICHAFGTLCKFLWNSHVKRLEENPINTPKYSFDSFKRLLSVMELGSDKRKVVGARYLAEKYGGSLICAYCQAVTEQMTNVIANCQQTCARYAQEIQVSEYTYQRALNFFKTKEQEHLTASDKEIRKVKLQIKDALLGKATLLQELSILASRVLAFNHEKSMALKGDTLLTPQLTRLLSMISVSLTPEAYESPTTLALSIKEALSDHLNNKGTAGRITMIHTGSSNDINDSSSNEDFQN